MNLLLLRNGTPLPNPDSVMIGWKQHPQHPLRLGRTAVFTLGGEEAQQSQIKRFELLTLARYTAIPHD
jgi:hypothetical protein